MGNVLPNGLTVLAHLLRSDAIQAVEGMPEPELDPTHCAFADPVEASLIERLLAHHASVPPEARAAWQVGRVGSLAIATGALGHLRANLTDSTPPIDPNGSLAVFGLRDPIEAAAFAAARTRQMPDSGIISAPQDVGLLIPEDAIYHTHLAQSSDTIGLPLAGLGTEPATRDQVGESLTAALANLRGSALRKALASLCTSPLAP